jgi:SAM-dependent methyltransferase
MKAIITSILKLLGIYYPVQCYYRKWTFAKRRRKLQRQYEQYRGGGFTCNCCGDSYSRFAPNYPALEDKAAIDRNNVIAGYGDNVICPTCLSTSRERLVIAMLSDVDLRGKEILHFSPETHVFSYISSFTTPLTADLCPGRYKGIDRKVVRSDLTQLGFAAERFDIVIANHILEHIRDDQKALGEISRVLRRGGMAILQVPYSTAIQATIEEPSVSDPVKQSALFGQYDHVRIYALNDYIGRLEQAGFTVTFVSYEALQRLHKHAIQPGEGFLRIKK